MQENGNSGKNQEELPGIKDLATEMKATFNVLRSRLDTSKQRISEPEDMSVI